MNTHSKKHQLPIEHPTQHLEDGILLIDTHHHFFTLPNMLDNHTYVRMVQRDTCLYNIQDLEPEEITKRLQIKKKQVRARKMRRMRQEVEIQAEKVKWLRRELWIMHKRSWTEDGVLGVVWWNQEYWGTGFGVKKLKIKKEEPLTPLMWEKNKSPSTPSLAYPPSRTSTSLFRDIDLNDFVWSLADDFVYSPVYAPSPI